ncbi:hypothetical protein FO519_000108 [Halicephalobus sp. NKZ332]|nr:hypothetical protein FO519_000108 [Halicephalobus sp. NKZ332]
MQFLTNTSHDTGNILNANRTCVSFKSAIESLILIATLIVILKIGISHYSPMQTSEFRILFNEAEKSVPWKSKAVSKLPYSGSVFCWVMTSSVNRDSEVKAVNQTWLPKCDHGEFFTSTEFNDEKVPATAVFQGFSESRKDSFWKTMYGFHFAFKKVSDRFDWYMKTDDDTYIFFDNLRHYLATFNASEPIYLGLRLKPYSKNTYNGGVYILSKAAVKLLLEKSYMNETLCNFQPSEDVGMEQCLKNIGITLVDTRDSGGRERFLPQEVDQMYAGYFPSESRNAIASDQVKGGFEALSPELISIHLTKPSEFRLAHLIRYHLKTYNKNRCPRRDLEV